MLSSDRVAERADAAKALFERNIGEHGLWASTHRYRWQCWTRDLALAGLEELVALGRTDVARKHLDGIAARQGEDGHVPILFPDSWAKWLGQKLVLGIAEGRLPIMVKKVVRLLRGNYSLEQLTPWTTDSELQYIRAVHDFARLTGDQGFRRTHERPMRRALSYAESAVRDGLIHGGDWRDTYQGFAAVPLLSNNVLLRDAYRLLGMPGEARRLEEAIERRFWNGGHHTDTPGDGAFDVYGQSLAVLSDLVPPDRYAGIVERFHAYASPFGFRINDISFTPATKDEKDAVRRVNQSRAIWPMVNGLAIKALLHMDAEDEARAGFERWQRLDGFWEWYDPETGAGRGSPGQMWSAAFYRQTARALGRGS